MPIMTKRTSSVTIIHATPVKANTGKLVVKNEILHIGEEPPVTALKQSSLASVLTAMTGLLILLILSNQESSPVSISTASTAMLALSILSSQLTTTTSSKQIKSSNFVCTLDFGNLPVHAKKVPYLIDFCNPVDVTSKSFKYPPDASDQFFVVKFVC
jgi:hypothetical protein